jgi:hypothetical protein
MPLATSVPAIFAIASSGADSTQDFLFEGPLAKALEEKFR